MVEKATAQVNIGRAAALLSSARAAVESACLELDQRIAAGIVPAEADYLRQMSIAVSYTHLTLPATPYV